MEHIPLGYFWGRCVHLVSNSRGRSGHLEYVTGTLWKNRKILTVKWRGFDDGDCVLVTACRQDGVRVARQACSSHFFYFFHRSLFFWGDHRFLWIAANCELQIAANCESQSAPGPTRSADGLTTHSAITGDWSQPELPARVFRTGER